MAGGRAERQRTVRKLLITQAAYDNNSDRHMRHSNFFVKAEEKKEFLVINYVTLRRIISIQV